MILRIEDTDVEADKRTGPGDTDGLKWLGVTDEGRFTIAETELIAGGKEILANGSAFLCYCQAENMQRDHANPPGRRA